MERMPKLWSPSSAVSLLLLIVLVGGVVLAVREQRQRGSDRTGLRSNRDVLTGTPSVFHLGPVYITVPPRQRTDVAEALALARWHGTHCNSKIRVEFVSYGRGFSDVVADARWSAGDSSTYFDCRIVFNLDHVAISFVYFCAALMHEYGHLSGWREPHGLDGGIHSRDPTSIMYPVLSARNIPKACKTPSSGELAGSPP